MFSSSVLWLSHWWLSFLFMPYSEQQKLPLCQLTDLNFKGRGSTFNFSRGPFIGPPNAWGNLLRPGQNEHSAGTLHLYQVPQGQSAMRPAARLARAPHRAPGPSLTARLHGCCSPHHRDSHSEWDGIQAAPSGHCLLWNRHYGRNPKPRPQFLLAGMWMNFWMPPSLNAPTLVSYIEPILCYFGCF